MANLLVVDDAFHLVRDGLDAILREHRVHGATDGLGALRLLEREPDIDVVLLDIRMPPQMGTREEDEGLVVFDRIRELRPELPVIFLSAYDDLRTINRALTAGGFWYLKKPPDMEETRQLIARALEEARRRRVEGEHRRLSWARAQSANASAPTTSTRLLGDSPVMHRLRAEMIALAPTDVPVLILGESGVGKELCARETHRLSNRRGGPFVPVNCAELNRLETAPARLFGHAKGAFTGADAEHPGAFEQADRGTLFLDEIAELNLDVQAQLLRALQEREVVRLGAGEKPRRIDVRLVFATNRDPQNLLARGQLREDFYYRIAVGVVRVPALRERLSDLELLATHLLQRAAEQVNLPRCTVTAAALEVLQRHGWPGNVRELENVLTRAALRAGSDGCIRPEHVELPAPSSAREEPSRSGDLFTALLEQGGYPHGIKRFRDEYGERSLGEILSRAILLTDSVVKAGELLGFVREETREKDYENLRAWMKSLGLRKADIAEGRGR